MLGIIDVGGGMRCVYSSGIYDCFLDKKITADYCLGVSAGSANLITYLAGQRGRTLEFYRTYAARKEYMSFGNLIKKGSYLDLDYIFSTLSNQDGENPLDFEKAKASGKTMLVTATGADDGEAKFFTLSDMRLNDYSALKASCCLPLACKPVEIDGRLYFDGGVAEPIPIEKALADGCDKIIIVLTKPRGQYAEAMRHTDIVTRALHEFPAVARQTALRQKKCLHALQIIEQLEKDGRAFVLAPEDCFGMKTLTRDRETVMKMYESGYRDAQKLVEKTDFLG